MWQSPLANIMKSTKQSKNESIATRRRLAFFFLILGSSLIFIGMGLLAHSFVGIPTTATITAIEERKEFFSEMVSTHYYPTLKFVSSDGKEIITQSKFGGGKNSYTLGTSIEIRYSPRDPKKITIQGGMEKWYVPASLFFLGVVQVIGSWKIFLRKHRNDTPYSLA